jgi:hypothetical protein
MKESIEKKGGRRKEMVKRRRNKVDAKAIWEKTKGIKMRKE